MMRRQPGCRIFMPNEFELAVAALQRDGVIAYATEAVFGLGCDPDSESAVHRLLAIKQRPVEKGLILIAADLAQLQDYIDLDQLTNEQLAGWKRAGLVPSAGSCRRAAIPRPG